MIAIPPVECRWPGATMALLATGPSLTPEDCARVRAAGLPTIAINDAYTLAPWADVLYSSDRRWWPHHHGAPNFTGAKVGIGSAWLKADPFPGHPDIQVLRNDGLCGLARDPSRLRTGQHSGYAAINLAVHYGAARILLLGYDLGFRADGKAHFFGDHVGLNQTAALYPTFRKHYDTMIDPLIERGIAVVNCTPGSRLQAFPMGDLQTELEVVPCPQ